MNKVLVIAASAVASALLAAWVFGAPAASADYNGQTYAQASDDISKRGGKAVISSVTGSHLERDDCIVTQSTASNFLDSSGQPRRGSSILLALNCNAAVAQPGVPGNSVATPEGKAAKLDHDNAEYFNTNPEWCLPGGKYRSPCAKVCKKDASLCSKDVLAAVATT